MEPTQITMRKLKATLSATVARAAAGEVIEVTSRGKLLARLIALPATPALGLTGLIDTGAVSWNGGKPDFAPPVLLPAQTWSISDTVIEDRG